MQLDRPLLFFDLETTGLDIEKARIIEIACVKVWPDRSQEQFDALINPGEVLSDEVVQLTGITNEMLTDAPAFEAIMPRLKELTEDADFAGYNLAGFDVPILEAEFERCGATLGGPTDRAIIDPLEILRKREVRTLNWAHQFYLGEPMPEAHRALNDVEATMRILRAQIVKYELKGSPSEIQADTRYPYLDSKRRLKMVDGKVMINFGKHRGKALEYIRQTHPDYIQWMEDTMDRELLSFLQKKNG